MEIEAKFKIPDRGTAERLKRLVRLGRYEPGAVSVRECEDVYLDTASRVLLQHGYACRLRTVGGRNLVTVKGLGEPRGGVHRRFESEASADGALGPNPRSWPQWEGREIVLSLAGEEALHPLFTVRQTRHVRTLRDGERVVAEMSIDEGWVDISGHQYPFCTLEIEQMEGGGAEDLQSLVTHLSTTWGLQPEPMSKFEIGLAQLDGAQSPTREEGRVSDTERTRLLQVAASESADPWNRWAQLLLGWADGKSVRQLCVELGFSRSWAYEVVQRFKEQRLGVFPDQVPESARRGDSETTAMTLRPIEPPAELAEPAASPQPVEPEPLSLAQVCERYHVDMAHAHKVADEALALFDATQELHKLGPERRRLLHVMAILHNVGLEADPEQHHRAGRDILLAHALEGLTGVEQRMLGAAVFLHRKRITGKRLKKQTVALLPSAIRSDTLVLAGILRVADGLDYSQSQDTQVEDVRVTRMVVRVIVSGPHAEVDAERAQTKADLWERVVGIPVYVSLPGASLLQVRHLGEPKRAQVGRDSSGVSPDDPMGEAGRKILAFHLERMIRHEAGTREGIDPEELHDMRVATRRMRAAFGVFGPYYKARTIRPFVIGLKRTARALGAVRDLDVFIGNATEYLDQLPPKDAHDLDPLMQEWEKQRERARERMLTYLDGPKYHGFVAAFHAFVTSPGTGVVNRDEIPPHPIVVRHVAPQMIYTRWAEVQAFGALLDRAPVTVLHALRIQCKRLRYALEFFQEILGTSGQNVIEEVTCLQDHLGKLNDADVANAMVSDFLFPAGSTHDNRIIAPGVVAYLATKQRELQSLIDGFAEVWARFNRAEVRVWLAEAVSTL